MRIRTEFGVAALSLFGSWARDEARPESDIDIMVRFSGPATFKGYFDLREYLESLLDGPVDLVTEGGLPATLRATVERDLIRVA
ncbi:MAG: nucleotidyltransferase family protein [Leptospirales bacterium]|nr:nucleotidyltransferase family protein [Leptospirales bacterium]